MSENEDIKNFKMLLPIAIYSILTYLWFDANETNSLILIGHTDLVNGWVNEHANKVKLFGELIYFSISIAAMIVVTQLILHEINIPFLSFEKDSGHVAAIFVNFFVFIYEFHVIEFRIKLVGLAVAMIIFFVIGYVLAIKILDIVRPILGIVDVAESVDEIKNTYEDNNKK